MKKLIMKLLGLETLGNGFLICCQRIEKLQKENEELKKSLAELTEKVDEMEIPDFDADDFVREDDINDRIETFINDNDIASQSYVDNEVESKVSDAIDDADIDSKIESAVEEIDLEEKVRELLGDASPAKMCEDAVRKQVIDAVKKYISDPDRFKISIDIR